MRLPDLNGAETRVSRAIGRFAWLGKRQDELIKCGGGFSVHCAARTLFRKDHCVYSLG